MRIFKYQLEVTNLQTIELPQGARILSVRQQGGQIMLWAMVHPTHQTIPHTFRIYGTGHPVDENSGRTQSFLGTVQLGALVFHVFEVR